MVSPRRSEKPTAAWTLFVMSESSSESVSSTTSETESCCSSGVRFCVYSSVLPTWVLVRFSSTVSLFRLEPAPAAEELVSMFEVVPAGPPTAHPRSCCALSRSSRCS